MSNLKKPSRGGVTAGAADGLDEENAEIGYDYDDGVLGIPDDDEEEDDDEE